MHTPTTPLMPKVSEAIAAPLYLLCEAQLLTLSASLPKELIMDFSIPYGQLPGLIFTIHVKYYPNMPNGCAHTERKRFWNLKARLGKLGGWRTTVPFQHNSFSCQNMNRAIVLNLQRITGNYRGVFTTEGWLTSQESGQYARCRTSF